MPILPVAKLCSNHHYALPYRSRTRKCKCSIEHVPENVNELLQILQRSYTLFALRIFVSPFYIDVLVRKRYTKYATGYIPSCADIGHFLRGLHIGFWQQRDSTDHVLFSKADFQQNVLMLLKTNEKESDAVKCQGQNSVSLGFMAVLQAH